MTESLALIFDLGVNYWVRILFVFLPTIYIYLKLNHYAARESAAKAQIQCFILDSTALIKEIIQLRQTLQLHEMNKCS